MAQSFRLRELSENDLESVVNLISGIVANEFNIQLKLDGFDSDLLNLYQHYNKDNGGCFWVAEKLTTIIVVVVIIIIIAITK